ncbi:hypothetical protein GCM10007981_18830 [Thermocladium modestius]|uniref:Uncharacterized protein n=1 Tax=Thermocladium modestius TaxID=62609 RepID=A0A830H0W4_9CREN|nr:hypothetical protein GCM10007981_18830 [Thermocladium modestius]
MKQDLGGVVKCMDLLLFPRVCVSRLYLEVGRNGSSLEHAVRGAPTTAPRGGGAGDEALLHQLP